MWHKARAQLSQGVAGQPCVGVFPKTVLSTCPEEAVLKVSNAQRRCKEETWPAGLTGGPHVPYSYKYHGAPLSRKCDESEDWTPQGASKFNHYRVEREERF
jgi:hypothetical protein